MFTLAFAPRQKVNLARFTGIVTSADLEALDQAALEFAARRGPAHAILDFSGAEAMALPETKIKQRGGVPPLMPGCKRIIVVGTSEQEALARLFAAQQMHLGAEPPAIVPCIECAFEALELSESDFTPLSMPALAA